jgi:uncharacterized repeat protein (TIGR01451 family)
MGSPSNSVFRTSVRLVFILSICMMTFFNLVDLPAVSAACSVSGVAYQDYNNNITRDGIEPGVGDVRVRAYQDTDGDGADELVSTVNTAVSNDPTVAGTYTLPITTPDGKVRIEFTNLPSYLEPGRFGSGLFGAGTEGDTTVTFMDCAGNAASTIDLPLFSVGAYCHSLNPDIGTSCYVSNDNLDLSPGVQSLPTFISFPYDVGGAASAYGTVSAVDQGAPENNMAFPAEIGTTWGLGYQASSDSFYVASFVRRHTGLGPNATGIATTTGGIYRIEDASSGTSGNTSLFMDLNAAPYNFGTGTDPHPQDTPNRPAWCPDATPYTTCWQVDRDTYPLVGKMGLGDIEMSEDSLRLYVVNLNRPAGRAYSEILSIPIGLDGVAPPAAQIGRYPLRLTDLPGASTICSNYNDLWPFALATHNERLYVGLVCTAESSGSAANLRAYVYSMDEFNPGLGFRQELTFPLNYPRGNANNNTPLVNAGSIAGPAVLWAAEWQPWLSTWPTIVRRVVNHPEPWLTGIVFDGEDMILALRDRMGDRSGNVRNSPSEVPGVVPIYTGIAAGDILRACYDATTQSYALENGGNCLGRPNRAAAINPAQGPGGDEFYHADQNDVPNGDDVNEVEHDEVTIGGVVTLPGSGTVAVTSYDPLWRNAFAGDNGLYDAGIIWFDNQNGDRTQSYRIVEGTQGGPGNNQGKSNGLGDMELVCGAAPLEIGNRVWFDENRNGIQDGNLTLEPPVVGVVLSLYMDTDKNGVVDRLVGETTTNADGGYYFNETNIYWDGSPQFAGLLGAAIANVNFDDVNGNGTREPIEAIGLLPNTVYEVRISDLRNYRIGGPLESTPGNEWYITQRFSSEFNDGNDLIRDSDGLPVSPASPSAGGVNAQLVTAAGSFVDVAGINNFPVRQLTTGSYGANNHTYDFGFVRQPVVPTPTPPSVTPGVSGTQNALLVSIEKSVNPPFASAGSTVTWTITVTNNSSNPATNVSVSDDLPPELTILSPVTASAGTVSVSGQTVTFSIASLNPGQRVEITVPTRISGSLKAPFSINNQATLQSDNPDGSGTRIVSTSSAKVLSAQMLPSTGETFFEQFRLPLLVMGVSLGLMVGMWLLGRVRVSKP